MIELRQNIARGLADSAPISMERLGLDWGQSRSRHLLRRRRRFRKSYGSADEFRRRRQAIFQHRSRRAGLGYGGCVRREACAARRPVVSVVGDGSFCFSGPQPLWTMARYKAPVTVIVLNNHSYNNERNRIWNSAGRQFEAGRDMTCYLGDPDVDYSKAASAFG